MKTRVMVIGLGLLMSVAMAYTLAQGQMLAKQYKSVALGPYSVGIVCLDGQRPIIQNNAALVIVNCPVSQAK